MFGAGGAAYFGPFIGYRMVSFAVDPLAFDDNGNEPAWSRRETGETTLITLGLRLGLRSALEGFHGDLYLGFGTTFGDLDLVKAPYLEKKDQLNRTFIQMGYSLGIGWD